MTVTVIHTFFTEIQTFITELNFFPESQTFAEK